MTVFFNLASGEAGSVFVPQAQYNADNVRAMVAARAQVIADVSALEA